MEPYIHGLLRPTGILPEEVNMRHREARQCWIEGLGWVPYPIRVPDPRPVIYELTPGPMLAMDHIKTVWCGPEALFPTRDTMHIINKPYRVTKTIDEVSAQDPAIIKTCTDILIRENPPMLCAWVYEIIPSHPGWSYIIWKCWDR
jgi:hypothetical protein